MNHIIIYIKTSIEEIVIAYGYYFIIALAAVFTTKWFSLHKEHISYVEGVLEALHDALSNQLGDRVEGIYQIWLSGMLKAQNGDFSNEDMLEEFIQFIVVQAKFKNIALSDSDIASLRPISNSTFTMLSEKSKITKLVIIMAQKP